MSISGIGAGSSSSLLSLLHQRRQDLRAMIGAVQSGDIAGAQQSLTSLQQDTSSSQTTASSTSQQIDPQGSSPLKDLATLISSVQSGDIDAAQTALTAFQQDRAAAPSGGSDASQPAFAASLSVLLIAVQPGDTAGTQADTAGVPQTQPASTSADGANASPSAFVTDLTNLLQAVQSGDTAGAQADAAAVETDLQNATGGTTPVGGHHHHHHHGGSSGSVATSTTATDTDTGTSTGSSSDSLLADVLASYQGITSPDNETVIAAG